MPWLLYVSISADPRGSQYLYRALRSDNVLLAAQGALGLAKLKDKAAIPEIISAGVRFRDDKLLFAQALMYFDDREAEARAAAMLEDAALFEELRIAAKNSGYDPYPLRAAKSAVQR